MVRAGQPVVARLRRTEFQGIKLNIVLKRLQDAILHQVTLAVSTAKADEPTVYAMFSRLNAAGSRSNLGQLLHHWLSADAGDFVIDHRGNEETISAYRAAIAKHGIANSLTTLSR